MKSLLRIVVGKDRIGMRGRDNRSSSDASFDSWSNGSSKDSRGKLKRREKTLNEKCVEGYIAAINAHSSVQERLKFYASGDVPVKFDDTPTMTAKVCQHEFQKICQSFTDLQVTYKYIKEVYPGEVVAEGLRVSGTHNGEPFAFGKLPAIPATGKRVVLDPECDWFTVENGKIVREDIIAFGCLTGPPGFYTAIGGKLE